MLICDFCGVPDAGPVPTRTYPCERFDSGIPADRGPTGTTNGYSGPWLACDDCSRLIDAGAWDRLVDRSVAAIVAGESVGRDEVVALRATVSALHHGFRRHRLGDGGPIDVDVTAPRPAPRLASWD